ncbi:MAG TPA: hypothetical protein VGF18_07780 [Candidatus Tumulicola sp.]|jgi:hypothetical protein
MLPIRSLVASASLLSIVLVPATAQPAAKPSAAKAFIERYLANVHAHNFRRVTSWVSPQLANAGELIYVSSSASLSIYSPDGDSLGVIAAPSGGNFGNGVAVDKQQNVYVGGALGEDRWAIFEYARGGSQPIRTMLLGDNNSDFSMGIAIEKNGTVYAAQPYDYKISEFAPGSTGPTGTLSIPPNNAPPFSLTVDNQGTLLALLAGSPSYNPAIIEYDHGKGSALPTPYQQFFPFGIAADAGNHIVTTSGDSGSSMLVLLRNDPVPIKTGAPPFAGFVALNRKSNRVYYGSALDQGPAGAVGFPSLRSVRTLQTSDNVGVAVSPAVNV